MKENRDVPAQTRRPVPGADDHHRRRPDADAARCAHGRLQRRAASTGAAGARIAMPSCEPSSAQRSVGGGRDAEVVALSARWQGCHAAAWSPDTAWASRSATAPTRPQSPAATGAFVDPKRAICSRPDSCSTPRGAVPVSVYSSGAIGRLVPDDVIGMVRCRSARRPRPATGVRDLRPGRPPPQP